jgi:glucose-1-phosphate adenylyltransferase
MQRGDNVIKKEMIAMLLAGGQGSRLGVLTSKVAKPAVAFGGKYKIIDFPLSNCINSSVDTVGVLTQYQPLRLNAHIGIGIPWDLDRNIGGVTVLPPYEKSENTDWYTGTANAIFQNLDYMDSYNPDYVLILSGDHIYKMDYEIMLDYHKANNADVTLAVMPVPIEEASRFGVVVADEENRIKEFQEKPEKPKSNLASMGIYIFSWPVLKEALIKLKDQPSCDFGKHVIPYCHEKGDRIFAYEFNGYWKDVGTLHSYWEANMELIDIVPEFNLYEEYWKIYTKSDVLPPQYISDKARVDRSIVGEGCEIFGTVCNSVVSANVVVEEGAEVYDSIIMQGAVIKKGTKLHKAIVAEGVVIGEDCRVGVGEYADSKLSTKIYNCDLAVIGENSVIPDGVTIGKNTAIVGKTDESDYTDGKLESGDYIIKAGEI